VSSRSVQKTRRADPADPGLVPSLPCGAPTDREAVRAEVIERMVQATRQPDDRCFELFRRVHVCFRK
jgi:hypothetical protein